ncbi:MAG TPA: hypothetical protein VJU87_03100 [Gemmatimonadaceae bacterium]|nr:hypothetical protein [Gemmatimonadaceae bacterium]
MNDTPDDPHDDSIPLDRLRRAVDEGVITQEQLDAIVGHAASGSGYGEAPTEPLERATMDAPLPIPTLRPAVPVPDEPRGLSAVSVAYYAGAIAVLFALGWFLAERWKVLGPGGVLAVAASYAALFLVSGRALARRGFHTAAAFTWLLVVGTTPLIAWALLALAGVWYEPSMARPPIVPRDIVYRDSIRWLPVDAATLVVAVVALWRTRFALLVLPVAIVVCYLGVHLVPVFFDPMLTPELFSSMLLFIGSLLLLAGDAVDRWQPPPVEDYAQWLYIIGLGAATIGVIDLWHAHPQVMPHIVVVLAVLLVVASLYLRRRVFLVFGAAGLIAYLSYLAFDVFRRQLGFPIVLASFGLALILLTVWFQRRYPAMARRVARRQGANRPTLPGGYYFFAVAAVLTFVLLLAAPDRIRGVQARRQEQQRLLEAQLRQSQSEPPRRPAPDTLTRR